MKFSEKVKEVKVITTFDSVESAEEFCESLTNETRDEYKNHVKLFCDECGVVLITDEFLSSLFFEDLIDD